MIADIVKPRRPSIRLGCIVRVWTGQRGRVRYLLPDWVGVQLQGELTVHQWHVDQVEAVS